MYSFRNFSLEVPTIYFNDIPKLFSFFPAKSFKNIQYSENQILAILNLDWSCFYKNMIQFFSCHFSSSILQVCVPVAPLRSHFNHASEMVSQLLLGEKFISYFEVDNFHYGYCEDGYWGYVSSHQLKPFEDELFRSFELNTKYPIGSKTSKFNKEVDIHRVIDYLINTPYLWGGKSNWGIDCSGLSQLLMLSQNIILPRDAYQQADLGDTISFGNHQLGDLAFFGKSRNAITHVGFILDANTILHAYGWVRKDPFTHEGIFHSNYQKVTHQLVTIKRYSPFFNFWDFL